MANLSFSAIPRPEASNYPVFDHASPNHGPASGGTQITIEGRNLGQYGGISFIYIGAMKLPIKNWTRSLHDILTSLTLYIRRTLKVLFC